MATKPLDALEAVSRTEIRGVLERELELPLGQQDEHFNRKWLKEVVLRLLGEAQAART